MRAEIRKASDVREFTTVERCHIVEIANDDGDQQVSIARARVEPGDVVRIPPGTRQRIANTGDEDLLFYAVCSPPFSAARYRNLE